MVTVAFRFKLIEYHKDKLSIRQYLENKRVQNVVIKKNWFHLDRNTRIYNVIYDNREGEKRYRICKFHFANIYWDDWED